MSITEQLHIAAAGAFLILGVGALAGAPSERRSRLFAMLCAALALWTGGAGIASASHHDGPDAARLYLLGSCAAAPLALHLMLELLGARQPRWRRVILPLSYLGAGLLYLGRWTPIAGNAPLWNLLAIATLGSILLLPCALLLQRARRTSDRAERRALQLLLAAVSIAIFAGLSDLIPRPDPAFPRVGPLGVLLMMVVLCALIARYRFLDLNRYFSRAIVLLLGTLASGFLILLVGGVRADRSVIVMLAMLLVLALAGPLGQWMLRGARVMLGDRQALGSALGAVSRRLAASTSAPDLWQVIDDGVRSLDRPIVVTVYTRAGAGTPFRLVYRRAVAQDGGGISPAHPPPESLPQDAPIARLLAREPGPCTRRNIEGVIAAMPGAGLDGALPEFDSLGVAILAPLSDGGSVIGWVGLGGGIGAEEITGDVATALMAVANQAVATLDRAAALERSRRREALASLGEMAAGLAHEIRNPLAAIHGAAQVLDGEADSSRATEMLAVIGEESRRLGRVVGEFLEYARPGLARRESVDCRALLERAIRATELAGGMPRLDLQVTPALFRVEGDPDQLQRALTNILENARDAAGEGGLIQVFIQGAGASHVLIRFEDNGRGIAEAEMLSLFRPFHTTKSKGTGLGLALALRLVEAHGGEIRVEGHGTLGGARFDVVLPTGRLP